MATDPSTKEKRKQAAALRLGMTLPGNPARAAVMQAQFDQPVFRGAGLGAKKLVNAKPDSTAPGVGMVRDVANGAAKAFTGLRDTVSGVGKGLIATPADMLRNGVATAVGGDPTTLRAFATRRSGR